MELDHIFLELGLSEDNIAAASVTGLAAVRTDRKGKVLAAYSDSNKSLDDLYAGLSGALLKPYPSKYVIVSQHAAAYKGILDSYFRGKPWLDIAQLSWPLGFCDMIPDRTLDTLCKHFGIHLDAELTVSGNCELVVRAYWAMMQRYRTALLGEEAIRDIGGETLAKARKFLGF